MACVASSHMIIINEEALIFTYICFTRVVQALSWNLCPETAVSWLKLYFQMASMNTDSDLLEPQFSQDAYIQMTRVGVQIHLF